MKFIFLLCCFFFFFRRMIRTFGLIEAMLKSFAIRMCIKRLYSNWRRSVTCAVRMHKGFHIRCCDTGTHVSITVDKMIPFEKNWIFEKPFHVIAVLHRRRIHEELKLISGSLLPNKDVRIGLNNLGHCSCNPSWLGELRRHSRRFKISPIGYLSYSDSVRSHFNSVFGNSKTNSRCVSSMYG